MKSDIDIKDDVYGIIKGSALESAVSGKICKSGHRPDYKPSESPKEDIVISVLANETAQTQEAIVNVNIYVKDVQRGSWVEENQPRLRELCSIAFNVLEVAHADGFRFHISSQRIISTEDAVGEHIINNRIIYKQINE